MRIHSPSDNPFSERPRPELGTSRSRFDSASPQTRPRSTGWGQERVGEERFGGCETPLANEFVAPIGRARAPSLSRQGHPKQAHRFHGKTPGLANSAVPPRTTAASRSYRMARGSAVPAGTKSSWAVDDYRAITKCVSHSDSEGVWLVDRQGVGQLIALRPVKTKTAIPDKENRCLKFDRRGANPKRKEITSCPFPSSCLFHHLLRRPSSSSCRSAT